VRGNIESLSDSSVQERFDKWKKELGLLAGASNVLYTLAFLLKALLFVFVYWLVTTDELNLYFSMILQGQKEREQAEKEAKPKNQVELGMPPPVP
jgi:hypothetical protein